MTWGTSNAVSSRQSKFMLLEDNTALIYCVQNTGKIYK